jgi:hypothetical protein
MQEAAEAKLTKDEILAIIGLIHEWTMLSPIFCEVRREDYDMLLALAVAYAETRAP